MPPGRVGAPRAGPGSRNHLHPQLAARTVLAAVGAARKYLALAAACAAAVTAPSAQAADFSDTARNVLAPGQAGGLPTTPNSTDQIPLYDGLTPLFNNVSAADVNRLYKPNVFGTSGQGPTRV